MNAKSKVEEWPDSDAFLPTSDDLPIGGSELSDLDRFLESVSDEDDILNWSSFSERWSVLAAKSESDKISTLYKGVGLANLGNTCFLNAVLQCLLHTVPLLHAVLLDTHTVICQCSEEWFCVICALHELVDLSLTFSNRIIEPWKIVNNLSYFSTDFQKSQQEDAHEFLQCFLDRLERCNYWNQHDFKDLERDNFVKQVFGGCLVSKLKCCNCDHCSNTYEPSVDLSLEIEDADDLLTALQSFTKVEKIEDPENMFTCENCKEKVSVKKQLAFYQAPLVASFHLKRFKNDGCFIEKIDKHVAFPLELDMLPFTYGGTANYDELKYKLYAVVVHIGLSSTSGHYYCFIRLSPNVWCKFDDSKVVQVHEDFVLSQEAYILFYAKESTSWFSIFMETPKLCMESNILNTSPKSVLDAVSISESSPLHKSFGGDVTGSKYIEDEDNDNKENDLRCCVSTIDNFDLFSHESQKGVSPCSVKNTNLSQLVGACGKNQTFDPQTPLRSPSPEICGEDTHPSDMVFSIQDNHARPVDRIYCKRQPDRDLNDLETRQACSLIKKSIPGTRGEQLLAALKGSKGEVSAGRKKGRSLGSASRLDDSSGSAHHSSSVRPALRPLLAGGFQ